MTWILPFPEDLPESFEDHLGEWMEGFLVVLQYRNTFMAMDDDDSEPGPISVLQARTTRRRLHAPAAGRASAPAVTPTPSPLGRAPP